MVFSLLALLCGLALVFAGINYPLDVGVGGLLGLLIGYTAATGAGVAATARWPHHWFTVAVCWMVLICGGGLAAVILHPGIEPPAPTATDPIPIIAVVPPTPVTDAARRVAPSDTVRLDAATNGHLLVAALAVVLPSTTASREDVRALVTREVNTLFPVWPALQLLTVTVSAQYPGESGQKVGTLYTATVAREQCPAGGFLPNQPLPGKKYYSPRYYH